MAQSVEQLIRNQQVAGSSPASSSKNNPSHFGVDYFFTDCMDGLEGGSRFAGAKRFALSCENTSRLQAKSAINNCRAGRLR